MHSIMQDFHPSNFHNQKRVWIAQQKLAAQAAREKERLAEYRAEAAVHETKGCVPCSHPCSFVHGSAVSVGWIRILLCSFYLFVVVVEIVPLPHQHVARCRILDDKVQIRWVESW